jgi:hypothetical protein
MIDGPFVDARRIGILSLVSFALLPAAFALRTTGIHIDAASAAPAP